jgi:EAL domain-containing protein (putative c-di-GMP-specific phosphodiesterase class I)
VEKIELQNSIIRAIEKPVMERLGEQFFMHYQPKLFVSVLEDKVLHVERIEAEALIRWNHPEKGLIMPSTFIPLAEETGIIIPLGKWLIYQCVQKLASWAKSGRPGIGVSINLSAQQFRSADAAEVLKSAIASSGIDPGTITVEITETCLFEDIAAATVVLRRFEDLGVRLSVDDFGTGFSSLSHLHRFPLDEIKIDRLFVENLAANHQDRIIVRSLVSLAEGLGLSLVAEGVERRETLDSLWDMGCRAFQGYLIAKPLPPEDFIAFHDRIVADGYRFRLPG